MQYFYANATRQFCLGWRVRIAEEVLGICRICKIFIPPAGGLIAPWQRAEPIRGRYAAFRNLASASNSMLLLAANSLIATSNGMNTLTPRIRVKIEQGLLGAVVENDCEIRHTRPCRDRNDRRPGQGIEKIPGNPYRQNGKQKREYNAGDHARARAEP